MLSQSEPTDAHETFKILFHVFGTRAGGTPGKRRLIAARLARERHRGGLHDYHLNTPISTSALSSGVQIIRLLSFHFSTRSDFIVMHRLKPASNHARSFAFRKQK